MDLVFGKDPFRPFDICHIDDHFLRKGGAVACILVISASVRIVLRSPQHIAYLFGFCGKGAADIVLFVFFIHNLAGNGCVVIRGDCHFRQKWSTAAANIIPKTQVITLPAAGHGAVSAVFDTDTGMPGAAVFCNRIVPWSLGNVNRNHRIDRFWIPVRFIPFSSFCCCRPGPYFRNTAEIHIDIIIISFFFFRLIRILCTVPSGDKVPVSPLFEFAASAHPLEGSAQRARAGPYKSPKWFAEPGKKAADFPDGFPAVVSSPAAQFWEPSLFFPRRELLGCEIPALNRLHGFIHLREVFIYLRRSGFWCSCLFWFFGRFCFLLFLFFLFFGTDIDLIIDNVEYFFRFLFDQGFNQFLLMVIIKTVIRIVLFSHSFPDRFIDEFGFLSFIFFGNLWFIERKIVQVIFIITRKPLFDDLRWGFFGFIIAVVFQRIFIQIVFSIMR